MNFFVLRPYANEHFGRHFAYADILDPQIVGRAEENGICPRCGHGMGMLPWLPPHRIRLSSKRYPDFLWGAGLDVMVSDRLKALWEQSGLTGITRFDPPAEIVKVGGRPAAAVFPEPPKYHNVWYLRGGASLDDRESGAVRLAPMRYPQRVWKQGRAV